MSQTNCECNVPSITVPLTGIELKFAESAFDGIGGALSGSCLNFSTEEQWTGKRWIDGKKIYQKTIMLNAPVVGSGENYTPHDISSLDQIIGCQAFASHKTYGETTWVPMTTSSLTGQWELWLLVQGANVFVRTKNMHHNFLFSCATLIYTCTDR